MNVEASFEEHLTALVWSAACFVGVVGWILSMFRARRKQAIAMAYLSIGLIAFFVLWNLSRLHWDETSDWVGILVLVLLQALPCAIAMALILYHRHTVQPPKTVPPPPPQEADK